MSLLIIANVMWGHQKMQSNIAYLKSPHLKIPFFTVFFLPLDLAPTLYRQFGPHNYTHGWKAIFAAQILAPRFGGLEAVTNAQYFFQHVG